MAFSDILSNLCTVNSLSLELMYTTRSVPVSRVHHTSVLLCGYDLYLKRSAPLYFFQIYGGRLANTTSEWLDGFEQNVADQRFQHLRPVAVRGIYIEIQRRLFLSNANMRSNFAQHLTTSDPVHAAH